MTKIIVLAGSNRVGSFNKILAKEAYEIAKKDVDAEYLDLNDYNIPLFDFELEAPGKKPESVLKLKQKFIEADGFIIASPEHNSSISSLLKNTIDWISRSDSTDPYPLCAFKGKVAGLVSASPGMLGGLRGLVHVRAILGNIGVICAPSQVAIAAADKEFADMEKFRSSNYYKMLENAVKEVVGLAKKLS